MPLLQPLCLTLLGFVFLANAYSNGKTAPKEHRGWRLWPGPGRRREPEAKPGTAVVTTIPSSTKRPYGDVTEFLRTALRPSDLTGSIEISSLHPHYCRWCVDENKEPLPEAKFKREVAKRLDDAGFPRQGDVVMGLQFAKPKLIGSNRALGRW